MEEMHKARYDRGAQGFHAFTGCPLSPHLQHIQQPSVSLSLSSWVWNEALHLRCDWILPWPSMILGLAPPLSSGNPKWKFQSSDHRVGPSDYQTLS